MNTSIKSSTIFFILLLQLEIKAHNYNTPASAYTHLHEVNKRWSNHINDVPKYNIVFLSDIDHIQYHLLNVENILRKDSPKGISAEILKNRLLLLDELHNYALNKIFPTNLYHSYRQPYFIDDYGVYCAVGYLISVSGHDELARQIRNQNNYDYIQNIKNELLQSWVRKYGFSVDELAWIQPTYAPTTIFEPLQYGTTGPVDLLYADHYYGRNVFAGSFDTVNNFPCKNIAYYKAGEFYCFDEGLTGAIHDVYNIDGEIHVAGHLEHNDNIYPLARFEGTTWSYTTIPGREDATGTIVLTGGLDHSKEVAINHASIPGKQELWYKMDDGSWQKQITVNGVILAAGASSYGSIYAGHFDSVTIHRDGFEDSVIIANNVVIRENYPDNYYSIGQEISDTVLVIKAIGSAIYFGGICSSEAAKSNVCLTRYLGETLQPLIISDTFIGSTTNSIHAIELYNETDLILSGEFEMSEYFGTYGSNLATYDLVYNSINAIGDFNKKVTGLAELLDGWYIGGHFTINNTSLETLPHLAKIVSSDFISEISNDDLLIYPNPTDNILNINMKYNSNIEKLYIVDLMGRNLIQLNNYTQPLSIDISGLANGLYILVIESSDKEKFYKSFEVN